MPKITEEDVLEEAKAHALVYKGVSIQGNIQRNTPSGVFYLLF